MKPIRYGHCADAVLGLGLYERRKDHYFRRIGDQLQMADAMLDAGVEHMSQAKLSSIMRGHHTFTIDELQLFCDVLECTDEEFITLYRAWVADERTKPKADIPLNPDDYDEMLADLSSLRPAMYSGEPKSTFWNATTLAGRALRLEHHCRARYLKRQLRPIRVEATLTAAEAKTYYASGASVEEFTSEIFPVVERLALSIGADNLLGMALERRGESLYITRDTKNAVDFLTRALPLLSDPEHHLLALRTTTLCHAYNDDRLNFDDLSSQLEDALHPDSCEANPVLQATAREGLGRAQCIMLGPEGLDTLTTAMAQLPSDSPMLPLQYARSIGEGLLAIRKRRSRGDRFVVDPAYLQLIHDAEAAARILRFMRHADQLRSVYSDLTGQPPEPPRRL